MNFAMVGQTLGQKDEKGYQTSLTMFAKLLEIGVVKLDKNNKAYASCKMMDDNNATHSATIRAGSKGIPTPDLLGKRCIFSLQPYQGQQGLAFSGFCNGLAAPGSYTPPQGQQAPQQPPKAPSAGQSDQERATRLSIERQTAWRGACDKCAGMEVACEYVVRLAQAGAYFIATGFSLADTEQIQQEKAQLESELAEPQQTADGLPVSDNIPF